MMVMLLCTPYGLMAASPYVILPAMIWILLVVTHLIGLTAYTLLLRKQTSSPSSKLFIAFLMQVGLFAPALLYLPLNMITFSHSFTSWVGLGVGALLLAGYMVFNVMALSKLDASVFTILFNVRIFVVTILGYVLLRELPTSAQVVGGIVIFGSIVYLYMGKQSHWNTRSTYLGIVTMGWFSVHALLEKYNLRSWSPENYLFFINLLVLLILLFVVLLRRINVHKEFKRIWNKSMLLLMIARSLSAYGYVYALMYGSLAVTSYISSMSVVLIVVFGIYILKEHDHRLRKIGAAGIALVGMTIIFLSQLV